MRKRRSSYSTRCSARSTTHLFEPPTGIIAAAGRGERMGLSSPKQFIHVGGQSLVRRALDMLRAGACSPVVIVLPEDQGPPDDVADSEVVAFVTGGPTRQESVANALRLVTSERVVIHDAVRPLADVSLLERVLVALKDVDGVTPAVPMDETIKRVEAGFTVETVDRTDLWRAQTPSAFATEMLLDAHHRAANEGFTGTDEGQLVQRYGGKVAIVRGSRMNIKVTYPEDIHLVESILGEAG
jgi:2-C-methyl-D-erythritol 4-phosphate cytidylyltransferase